MHLVDTGLTQVLPEESGEKKLYPCDGRREHKQSAAFKPLSFAICWINIDDVHSLTIIPSNVTLHSNIGEKSVLFFLRRRASKELAVRVCFDLSDLD